MNKSREQIQAWFNKNEPSNNFSYKQIWWKNNVFIRDRIMELFNDSAEIVGTHYSKSIECPVIKTRYKDVEVIWQYNFYNWQIMIKSKKSLKLNNLELLNADGDYFYYQGIPTNYQFKPYSEENNQEFAICTGHEILDVWGFALELKYAIDNTNKTYSLEQIIEEWEKIDFIWVKENDSVINLNGYHLTITLYPKSNQYSIKDNNNENCCLIKDYMHNLLTKTFEVLKNTGEKQ